ncbi:methylated-DNA--[protein]-cysteine S-methyltransferase [Neorhizobium sp. JUb45]|uniref:methylated-DNA--[protein]-cysteine S-methyltransferase n=1 Tax=Neorhizobium sp. JUb45 TaxID=2485113 RepID=UPI0010538F6D|nr:methylated-DNA--[protein]-cysteine S-methyltransferase [Neorhizobium sp. JUb45]TCR02078.1 AraC family transcriptional regulator of adaptative response/methylated-DNA-[protein]-cysteine methyltransferase [Neorhizobium sp. JUb45]
MEGIGLSAKWFETPIGPILAVTSETHLVAVEFHDEKTRDNAVSQLERKLKTNVIPGGSDALEQFSDEFAAYLAGKQFEFRVPLHYEGTEFERRVWRALLDVPLGETCSYGDLARAIGEPTAFRAVAQANNANRIPIVIPCHRCIGSDGSLTGFGGGLWRKKWLLRHEGDMRPVGLFALS